MLLTDGTTKDEYVKLLISKIEKHNELFGNNMIVRLIISIDRSKIVEENFDILELAIQVRSGSGILVGIDLSGNPTKGRFNDFVGLLQKCRDIGLFITVHAGEVPDTDIEGNKDRSRTRADCEITGELEINGKSDGSLATFSRRSSCLHTRTEIDDILLFG